MNEENIQELTKELQNSLNRIRKNQEYFNYLKQISKNIDTASNITNKAEEKLKLTAIKKMSAYKRWLYKQKPHWNRMSNMATHELPEGVQKLIKEKLRKTVEEEKFSKFTRQINKFLENYYTKDRILQKLKKQKAESINPRLLRMIKLAENEGIVFINDYQDVIDLVSI